MQDRISRTIQKYDNIADEYANAIANRLPRPNLKIFLSLIPKPAKVLDIGCAAGRDTKYIHQKGMEVIGIDLSEKLIQIAQKNNPNLTFQICDMRKLPFANSSFDGIWAHSVFHHLEKSNMSSALQEWARVLKNNGVIYLRTKMGQGNWKGKDTLSIDQEREFTLLMPDELEQMFIELGLQKISLEREKDLTRDIYWIRTFFRK